MKSPLVRAFLWDLAKVLYAYTVTAMRKIIHVDMDCFYAAVEMREHPQWRHIPLAIGGSSDRRGVIATCNYPARRFGIHSAMATAHALKLCPQLKVIPGRMPLYKSVSKQLHAIFARYTSLIEPLSLDEAYLDVTDCEQHHGSATLIAEAIRADIARELSLTASAGVAPIKFVAKVASDANKPDGILVVPPDQLDEFVAALPLSKIPGVGKATQAKLAEWGLYTAADVRQVPLPELVKRFGKFGLVLGQRCAAIDERPVVSERIRKSIGVEKTLATDINGEAACWQLIEQLLPELQRRIDRAGASERICKQGVKVKFADFRSTTVEHSGPGMVPERFRPLLQDALTRSEGKGIRLIGLTVGLRGEVAAQLALPLEIATIPH